MVAGWLLFVVSLLYLGTAVDLFIQHKPELATAFIAYAVANFALILAGAK